MRAGIVALLLLLLTGCVTREGELAGQVFVVTKDGQNVKLGLVTIVAIPEEVITKFIDQKAATATDQSRDRAAAVQMAKEAVTGAEIAVAAAKEQVDRATLTLLNSKKDSGLKHYSDAKTEYELSKTELSMRQAELSHAEGDRDILDSSDFYFADLPDGIVSAKTNADGLFSMTLPRHGRFALAARTSRQVVDEKENYYWLVWVSLDGAAKRSILLANDNLTTVASPESVITLSN